MKIFKRLLYILGFLFYCAIVHFYVHIETTVPCSPLIEFCIKFALAPIYFTLAIIYFIIALFIILGHFLWSCCHFLWSCL